MPAIPGPLAVQNAQAYRRYAVVQQVLLLGHGCVSVQPELLLLSDPLPLLPQHPADVSVLSTAWGDEHQAYGESSKGSREWGLAAFTGLAGCRQASPTAIHAAHQA